MCVHKCLSLWSGCSPQFTFSIQCHIAKFWPLTCIKQYIQWHLIHCKCLHMGKKAYKDCNFVSRHALSWTTDLCFSVSKLKAAPALTLTESRGHLPFVLQPVCRGILTKWHELLLLWVFYCLNIAVTISFLWVTAVTAVDSRRLQEGERAIISNRGKQDLTPNLSSSSHQRMGLKDKVFLAVWGVGIRDSISLEASTDHAFCGVNCTRCILIGIEDGW